MKMKQKFIVVSFGFIGTCLSCLPAVACDLPGDFKLRQLKSLFAEGAVDGDYPEIGVGPETLSGPFKDALQKRGVMVDRYDGYLIEVELQSNKISVGTTSVYAVTLSFEYTEPCEVKRIGLSMACTIWDDHEPLRTFSDPIAARKYVVETVQTQVKSFIDLFDHQVDCSGKPFR